MRNYYKHIRCESGEPTTRPQVHAGSVFDRLFTIATSVVEGYVRGVHSSGGAPRTQQNVKEAEFTVIEDDK